jgi:major membrane immunogen (membrane-anchored lipoprotein)
MKKWYSIGLLLLVLVLAASLLVACGTKDETTTTVAPVTTVAPETTTTVGQTTGIFFEDQGSSKVLIWVVPDPGQKFTIGTEGAFGDKIEAFDAAGKSLGFLELLDAANGVLDYSAVAGIAKIVVTDVPHDGATYEYLIP